MSRFWILFTFIFICTVNGCPTNIAVGSKCFEVIIDARVKSSLAAHHCHGAANYTRLAEPLTPADNDIIKQTLQQVQCNDEQCQYWFGLKRVTGAMGYQFHHNTTVTYGDWSPLDTHTENCVVYAPGSGSYHWKSERCSRFAYFICERKDCPPECVLSTTTVVPSTHTSTSTHHTSTFTVPTQPTDMKSSGLAGQMPIPFAFISFLVVMCCRF